MIWKIGRKKRLQLYLSRLIASRAAVTRVRDPCQRFPPRMEDRTSLKKWRSESAGRFFYLLERSFHRFDDGLVQAATGLATVSVTTIKVVSTLVPFSRPRSARENCG